MNEDKNHTALPYGLHIGEDYIEIYDAENNSVFWSSDLSDEGMANFKFIVRASNSYYQLLEELKRSQKQLKENFDYIAKWNPNDIRNTSLKFQIKYNEKVLNNVT